MNKRYALVTASDRAFRTGTEVLLWSFLRHNPWFEGDVIILDGGLSRQDAERLGRWRPVRFVKPDPRLAQASASVAQRNPHFQRVLKRFLGLQAFHMPGYDRAVWIDSDAVCLDDCLELFTRADALAATPDSQYYLGMTRNALSYTTEPPTDPADWRIRAFNAGVLSIGGIHLDGRTYQAMLDLMPALPWESMERNTITDQRVANEYFQGNTTALSAAYNFQPWLEQPMALADDVDIFNAKILHFSWHWKPWQSYRASDLACEAPHYIKHLELWHQAYCGMWGEEHGQPDLEDAIFQESETRSHITHLFRRKVGSGIRRSKATRRKKNILLRTKSFFYQNFRKLTESRT